MRKRNIIKTADTIFWYVFYSLPLIYFALYLIAFGHSNGSFLGEDGTLSRAVLSFTNFLNILGMQPSSSNGLVYSTLNRIFGNAGIFPLFQGTSVPLLLGAYYVNAVLLHLAVDFLLFIPKLCMKYMDEFTKE